MATTDCRNITSTALIYQVHNLRCNKYCRQVHYNHKNVKEFPNERFKSHTHSKGEGTMAKITNLFCYVNTHLLKLLRNMLLKQKNHSRHKHHKRHLTTGHLFN